MHVRIGPGPIDEAEAVRLVSRPENGAVLVFRGVVRNHHRGRAVSHIDYHAYREMAERELHRVVEETAEAYGIPDLAVFHRVGDVQVGEVSLLVAAAAPHRRPVFEGLLYLIDELKRRVPIWKKEYGPDGSFWAEGLVPPAGSVPEVLADRPSLEP
jgi:molybdopterin synthase catalytic subunit